MARLGESGVAGVSFRDLIAPLFALLAQGPAHQPFVVNNEHFLPSHRLIVYWRTAHEGVTGITNWSPAANWLLEWGFEGFVLPRQGAKCGLFRYVRYWISRHF